MRGTLPKANVVLITTASADPADRDAVLSLLNRAGATVTAQIQLTNDFSDPARADELRSRGRDDTADRRDAAGGAAGRCHRRRVARVPC